MSFRAAPRQIFKLAMRMEEVGKEFYQSLAAKTTNLKVKKVCLFLAEEEGGHRQIFEKMSRDLPGGNEEKEFSIDVLAELTQAAETFRDTGFTEEDFLSDAFTLQKCLGAAIRVEKESVDLYQKIQASLIHKGFQQSLYKIIAEERRHAEMLENVLAVIKGKKAREKTSPSGDVSETVSINDIEKKVVIEKKIVKTKKTSDLPRDYVFLLIIFIGFLGLILAMVGPRFFMKLLELIK